MSSSAFIPSLAIPLPYPEPSVASDGTQPQGSPEWTVDYRWESNEVGGGRRTA